LKKRPQRKRKAVRHREEDFVATAPYQAWSVDFVADQLHDGTRFRALTILDVYTREGVAIEAGQSLKGEDVVRVLNRVKQQRGVPKFLFCDNGSEFTSQAMDLWAYQNGMKIDFSRPGKPTDKYGLTFRFCALYDKVYLKDVLMYACKRCKASGGAARVNNQTLEDIEQHSLERWLDELAQELKSRTYEPQPVRAYTYPSRWKAEAVRDTNDSGSGCADGSTVRARTYFRSRLAVGAVCLSGRPQRVGRSATCPQADEYWP
jgi:transposase InsO family protein